MEKKNINRRNFLSAGLAAAATVNIGKSLPTARMWLEWPQ